MKNTPLFILAVCVLFAACGGTRVGGIAGVQNNSLNEQEQSFVDSLLQYGLENEALYTLLADIKPMSSLKIFYLPINTDTTLRLSGNYLNRKEHGRYLDRLRMIQQAINKLDIPDLRFVAVPYVSATGNQRAIQLSVVRVSALDSLLSAKESFFGQLGLVPGADPYAVLTAIEGNDSYSRWRGYGYLFGYPDYAVDFYNIASHAVETTGQFVKRNFFRIPVYNTAHESNFVYAYPYDHSPAVDVDSLIYLKSVRVLEQFKSIRDDYLNPDSTVRAYKLLQDYYRK